MPLTLPCVSAPAGFNAVRLPFSFTDLFGKAPVDRTQTCPNVSAATLRNNTQDASAAVPSGVPLSQASPPVCPRQD